MDEQNEQSPQGPDLSSLGQNVYQGRGLAQRGAQIGARLLLGNPVTVAVIAVLVVVILVFILPNKGAAGELPAQSPLPLGECKENNTAPCLLRDFNIEAAPGFPEEYAKQVYKAFSIAYQSQSFKELWEKGGQKLTLKYAPPSLGEGQTCEGQAFIGTQELRLWKFDKCTFETGNAYLILHESAHILSGRNNVLFNSFDYKDLSDKDGEGCFKTWLQNDGSQCRDGWMGKNAYLKTYIGPGLCVKDEDFAEAVADFILYRSWRKGDPATYLPSFPTQCKNTYNWVYENIFKTNIKTPEGL